MGLSGFDVDVDRPPTFFRMLYFASRTTSVVWPRLRCGASDVCRTASGGVAYNGCNRTSEKRMNITLTAGPLVSLIAGILILIVPRLLNYIVAIYLIIIGLLGLFGASGFHLR
jgi:hypothetical protein